MLHTSFPKLKKHHPTRLYMVYPMVQSVGLVCVEQVKKLALQGGIVHCPLLSIVIGNPRNHFSIQILNFDFIYFHLNFWIAPRFTVGAANNTPACQREALPARYRRTAPISTYTDKAFCFDRMLWALCVVVKRWWSFRGKPVLNHQAIKHWMVYWSTLISKNKTCT